MLAGTMRNHIEITAGKSTRPSRTRSRNPEVKACTSMGTIESMSLNRLLHELLHEFESIERRDSAMVSRMVEITIAGIAGQTNIAGLTWQEYM